MNQIDTLIAEHCPEGVEFKKLGEIGNFIRGSSIQKSDFTKSGIGCIHYGQIHTHYGTWAKKTKSFIDPNFAARLRKAHTGDLVIATTSEDDEAVAKAVAWLGNEEVAVSSDAYIFQHILNPKYVSYFFQTELFQSQKKSRITGTKVRRVSGENLAKIRIPLPPLVVQRAIVRILDRFTALETELTAELTARRRQYQHYRDALLSLERSTENPLHALIAEHCPEGVEFRTLEKCITKNIGGGTPSRSVASYWDGDIPWASVGDLSISGNFIHATRSSITTKGLKNSSSNIISKGDVIVAIKISPGKMKIAKKDIAINQDLRGLKLHERLNNRFLTYYFQTILITGNGAIVKSITINELERIKIPLPPLVVQRAIVSHLDKFDALVNDLSNGLPAEIAARRQQYQHYRDRLLSFKERT